jgi:hypothetical protein
MLWEARVGLAPLAQTTMGEGLLHGGTFVYLTGRSCYSRIALACSG